MAFLFKCSFVTCLNPKCDGRTTRLPRPNPQDTETSPINSPTASEPLLVLCSRCGTVSRYVRKEDLETGVFPDAALSEDTPFYLAEIVCDTENCGPPIRMCTRFYAGLPTEYLVERAMKYAGGADARCPKGHPLSKDSAKCRVVRIQEKLTQ